MKNRKTHKELKWILAEKEAIKHAAQKILNDTGDYWFAVWYSNHKTNQLKEKYQSKLEEATINS